MAYASSDFWAEYAGYVKDSFQRHADTFRQAMDTGWSWKSILDFGCGRVMEGGKLAAYFGSGYMGVDVDPDPETKFSYLKANYRTELDRIATECSGGHWFVPDLVLSLFSIEPTGDSRSNNYLYHRIFETFPHIDGIVSAGFFYESKSHAISVTEAGGLESFQTIGPLASTTLFSERRILERGPSKLFGPDVIEVWRILSRRRDV